MANRLGGVISSVPDVYTRRAIQALGLELERLGGNVSAIIRNNEPIDPFVVSSISLTAGAGLTGGGDLSADRTFAVDLGYAFNWTGIHTFSAESVHNGGIDLGTSGRFDSNVANAASGINFYFKPTTTLTSTAVDRFIAKWEDASGNFIMGVMPDRTISMFSAPATQNQALLSVGRASTPGTTVSIGFEFAPTGGFTSAGVTLSGKTNVVAGGYVASRPSTNSTNVRSYALIAENIAVRTSSALTEVYGILAKAANGWGSTTAVTHTELGGILIDTCAGSVSGSHVVTDWHQLRIKTLRSLSKPTVTNAYGIRIDEITGTNVGSTIKNEIMLEGAGGIFFRDQALYIESTADGHLDLYADTSIDMNGDVDISAKNVITDTTTGTKIGTGTTQKVGFWNATPVAQDTGWSVSNETATRTFDANATSVDEIADVLGTLIETLKTYGILGA